MNPLDMTGPTFLTLYLSLLAGAAAMAAALRWVLRFPHRGAESEAVDLDPYEIAYLAGGEELAGNAAIASLVQRKALMVHPRGRTLTGIGALPAGLHPLERAFAQDRDPRKESRQKIEESMRDAKPMLDKTRDRLTELGLLMDDGPAWSARLLPTLPILAALLLGLAKVQVGLSRGKPVIFLIVLCLLTVMIGIRFVRKRPDRSRWGDRMLDHLRHQNAALRIRFVRKRSNRSRWGDRMLDHLRQQNPALPLTGSRRTADRKGHDLPHDLALALALFGTRILAGGPMNDLWTALVPRPTAPGWLQFQPRDYSSARDGWSGGGGDGWSGGGGDGGGCGGRGGGGGGGGGGCGGCGGGN